MSWYSSHRSWSALLLLAITAGDARAAVTSGHGAVAEHARQRPFVENRGQWPEALRFVCRTEGAFLHADARSLWIDVLPEEGEQEGLVLRLVFEGAESSARLLGEDTQRGVYNYFLGNDQAKWVCGVPTYAGLRWQDLYPGIDVIARVLEDGSLKYDLEVAPGADLGRVAIRCEGVRGIEAREDGELVLDTALLALRHRVGATFEILPDGTRRPIEVRHALLGDRSFGFVAPSRDPTVSLVIDPGLVWATYIGSSGGIVGDHGLAVAVHAESGDIFSVGDKDGFTFPMTPGSYQHERSLTDMYVARFAAADGSLVYSSVLGGSSSEQERALALAVDCEGRAVVGGYSFANDFPTTASAFDPVKVTNRQGAVVFRLSPSGDTLEFSTWLEGSQTSNANTVAIDPRTGSALVGGFVNRDFPVTAGAFQGTYNGTGDGFVARLAPSGSSLEWSTYFGGSNYDEIHAVALDEDGHVYLTGETRSQDLPTTPGAFQPNLGASVFRNAFVTKLAPAGDGLIWSTYLGSSGTSFFQDRGRAICVDTTKGVVVAGQASSFNFPTTPGAYQESGALVGGPFIARFDPAGSLLASTLFAGPGSDHLLGFAIDGSGTATFAGFTAGGLPTTPGVFSATYLGGTWDGIVARFSPSLTRLLYSSFVGGPSYEVVEGMAMTPEGRVALVGTTTGQYPTTPGSHSPTYNGGQTDGYVAVLDLLFDGVTPVGRSKPACRGPLQANAWALPTAGSTDFGLWASGAPPFATGKLLLGRPRSAPSTRAGIDLWIDPAAPLRALAVQADADGYVEVALPLTGAAPGSRFGAQFLFEPTPECPSEGPLATTPALEIVVQ